MQLNQILTEAGQSAFKAERLADYAALAAKHLAQTLPKCDAALEPPMRSALIDGAYRRAHARGIRRTRDHLSYLHLAATLGLAFEQNPLHRKCLMRAGWYCADGRERRISSFDTPLGWSRQWRDLTALDWEDLDPQHLARQTLGMQAGYDPDSFVAALKDTWRNRAIAVRDGAMRQAAASAHHSASALPLAPDAAFLFAICSLHLGPRFMQEPRFAAISDMFHPHSATGPATADGVIAALREAPL